MTDNIDIKIQASTPEQIKINKKKILMNLKYIILFIVLVIGVVVGLNYIGSKISVDNTSTEDTGSNDPGSAMRILDSDAGGPPPDGNAANYGGTPPDGPPPS